MLLVDTSLADKLVNTITAWPSSLGAHASKGHAGSSAPNSQKARFQCHQPGARGVLCGVCGSGLGCFATNGFLSAGHAMVWGMGCGGSVGLQNSITARLFCQR